MKYAYYILLGIALASCQQEAETEEQPKKEQEVRDQVAIEDSTKVKTTKTYDYYAGTIGLYGEDVLVEVCKEDLSISGGYWYLKHGKRIELSGSVAPKSSEWQLEESVKGVVTGNMTLQLSDDSLVGQWYAPGKRSELQPVVLRRVLDGNEGTFNPEFEEYERKKTITMYDGSEDREEETSDDLKLVRIGEYVLFQYYVIGTNAHVGHINGLAKMTSDKKAVFKGEEACELTLSFGDDEVNVMENDCSYYRGMRAYFDGTLKKVR